MLHCHNCRDTGKVEGPCNNCNGQSQFYVTCEACYGQGFFPTREECSTCPTLGPQELCDECPGTGYHEGGERCGDCNGRRQTVVNCDMCVQGWRRTYCNQCSKGMDHLIRSG